MPQIVEATGGSMPQAHAGRQTRVRNQLRGMCPSVSRKRGAEARRVQRSSVALVAREYAPATATASPTGRMSR
jgi:hypothetical protein